MIGDLKGAFDTPVGSPSPVAPVTHRSFDDVSGQRDAIYSNALRGVRALKPVENEKYRVEIADSDYAQDYNPSLSDEKKALMSRQSMQRAIKGRVRLVDKASGAVVDETETTLAHVPHLTPRGIFVRGGTIWAAKNQQRLRPGVYVLRQQNGDVKAQVNPKPGSGRGFDIQLEPSTGVFKLNVGQSGTRLYPLLRSMGVPDETIKEAWGEDLFKANWRPPGGHDAQEARKIVAKMGRRGDQDTATELLKDKLHEILGRAELDEETTETTLGAKYKNFNLDTMLNATTKMLKRSRDEVPDDVRDSQAFQSFHGPEDFFEERLSRGSDAMRKLLWRATREGNLGNVSPGLLNPAVDGVFQSGLMSSVEDTNPLEIMDARQTITRLGEGGISSNQAVPRSARGVQPSYFGIIDPIRAPEGQNIGVDMRLTDGALKGSDGRLYFKVRSRKGEEVTLSALQASQKPIAFPGEFAKAAKREFYKVPLPGEDGKYVDHVVTMDDISRDPELSASVGMHGLGKPLPPMVRVLDGEDIKWKPAAGVDYELPHGSSMFSRLTNMVPMTQGAKSQRTLMGARMHSQALPLQNPEAPLVQSANPDGTSIHDSMGAWMGAVKAKAPGRVVAVTPDHIDVVYAGGKKERHELYNNYPLARKTSLHNTPLVREGDAFKPGDVLAKSNFTDDKGRATMGANFNVGYMVGSGHTYEDGFKISESAARRLSSQHAYKHELELDKNIHSTKKADYSSIFQGKYKPEQISGIDDDGVIKEGTIVQPGDPVLLAVRKKTPRPGGVVTPSARSAFSDASQTWDHSTPGQVTDVVRTRKGIKVMISSVEPMTEGSKLTARYGNKGVVSQIVPDGEMPVGADGKPLDIIVNSLGVISRANPSVLAETLLGKVAQKTGKPYVLKSFDHDDLGDFALNEAKVNGINELDDVTDPRTGRKIKGIFTGVQHLMRLHHTAESGLAARDTGGYTSDDSPAKGGPEGCFIADQKLLTDQGSVKIGHLCEKRLGLSVLTWSEVLCEWVYRPVTDWFRYRAKVEDIVNVSYTGPASDREVFKKGSALAVRTSFTATKNHVVYTFNRGKILAGDLTADDCLVTRGVLPTQHQMSTLLGSMLGDSSITANDTAFIFQCEHSLKQVEYVGWKQSLWAGLGAKTHECSRPERQFRHQTMKPFKSSCITWCNSSDYLRDLYSMYSSGTKEVTFKLASQIDELAVAMWLLDDGCITNISKKAGRIKLQGDFATDGFSEQSVDILRARLVEVTGASFGKAHCHRTHDGRGYRITFAQHAAEKLIRIIAKYVPASVIPRSKRVLCREVAEIQKQQPPIKLDVVNKLTRVPARILTITPYKPAKPGVKEVNVYDITVDDTHSYCAGSALVSNSKKIALLGVQCLLSAGATNVLKDAKLIRGQRNDDYWRSVKLGMDPVMPEASGAHGHFLTLLKGAGVNVRENQGRLKLAPMTDADTDALAQHSVSTSETFDFETMQPKDGGLFDLAKTGGADGRHFTKIELPQKIPNPVMEEPIIRILGLTKQRFLDVLSGQEKIGDKTGPEAIETALKGINVEREIAMHVQGVKTGSKSSRDVHVRALNYLSGLKSAGVDPGDLMISKIPVIPPKFRPVIRAGKMDIIHDANYLYHDLMESGKNYTEAQKTFGDAGEEYGAMYAAAKAVAGLGAPINPKHVEQGVKGLLQNAIGVGDSPKFARFQRKVLGQAVDTVGRGVATPDPELDMDQVSIPKDMAWTVYRPYVIRRLVRSGWSAREAVMAVREQKPAALRELQNEMKTRPVYWDRAPALQRYNYVGAWPVLSRGNNIGVPQVVEPGANLDFDGDKINLHVPSHHDAVRDVIEKMMPSKNLWHPADFDVHLKPDKDYLAGLYLATSIKKNKTPRTFASKEDAYQAYLRGDLGVADPVVILDSGKGSK